MVVGFVFGEPVVGEFGGFDEGVQGFGAGTTELDSGAVEAGVAETFEGEAEGAPGFFGGNIGVFAGADEEEAGGFDAGFAGGVEEDGLFVFAVEFLFGETAHEGPEGGREFGRGAFEGEEDDGGLWLVENGAGSQSYFHSGGV